MCHSIHLIYDACGHAPKPTDPLPDPTLKVTRAERWISIPEARTEMARPLSGSRSISASDTDHDWVKPRRKLTVQDLLEPCICLKHGVELLEFKTSSHLVGRCANFDWNTPRVCQAVSVEMLWLTAKYDVVEDERGTRRKAVWIHSVCASCAEQRRRIGPPELELVIA